MRTLYALLIGALLIAFGIFLYAKDTLRIQNVSGTTSSTNTTGTDQSADVPLKGTEWVWLHTELPNGELFSTFEREKYILTLDNSARVQSTTDCNIFIGKYTVEGEILSFGPFSSTKKNCPESVESTYAKELTLVNSYHIVGDMMYLNLNRDTGRMVFEQK